MMLNRFIDLRCRGFWGVEGEGESSKNWSGLLIPFAGLEASGRDRGHFSISGVPVEINKVADGSVERSESEVIFVAAVSQKIVIAHRPEFGQRDTGASNLRQFQRFVIILLAKGQRMSVGIVQHSHVDCRTMGLLHGVGANAVPMSNIDAIIIAGRIIVALPRS